MPTDSKATHHHHIRKRIHKKHESFPHDDKTRRIFDKLIYIAVVIGPLLNITQLLKIWLEKNADGISLIAWSGYIGLAIVWCIYGILHKEKPIYLMNGVLIIINSIIVTGTLIYR